MHTTTLDAVLAARDAKEPVALVTDMSSGDQALVFDDRVDGVLGLNALELSGARRALHEGKPGRISESDGRPLFVQVFNPPRRLIVVGAVHIAQPLAPMAALAGYAVTVIDPRQSFASVERFPGVALSDAWPDDALAELRPDSRTAVVTLTHDPKLDDPALALALNSPAFYIGALGSRKTHASRLSRLRGQGFDDAALSRIHGPIGLAIGAKSPAEIAVAILGQITAVLHGKAAREAAA